MDTKHLVQRYRTWYVRVVIPPALKAIVGKREITRSLQTSDLKEANRKKHRVLADIHETIARATTQTTLSKDDAAYVMELAKQAAQSVRDGERSQAEARDDLERALDDHLERLGTKLGRDKETGHPLLTEAHERTLQLAMRVLSDDAPTLLTDALKDYLSETEKRVTKQTLAEKKRELSEFVKWAGLDVEASTVTRKLAGRYVSEKLLKKDHAATTTRDTLSHLSSWWAWLEDRGMLPENASNPWARMSRTVKDSTRGATSKRRPWTDAELLKLTQGVPEGDPLLPMIVIAAYAGLRREEVALLRTEDVHSDALVVREGKTEAAVRRVPLHPVLRPFVARLKEQATDTYLIPGLLTGGADERRGHAIGKRFATFKSSLGFKDKTLNFHTLRNSFAQRMENAEVPVSTTKLIIGHKRDDITYGTYSPGPMFKVLQEAVAKVTFGALDAHVSGLAGTVQVTRKMRRRYRRRALSQ